MFRITSYLLFLYIFETCSSQTTNEPPKLGMDDYYPRVVNGWPAKLGDVPYQVSIKTLKSKATWTYVSFCGGVIVARDKVLSAAHCFAGLKSSCEKIFDSGAKTGILSGVNSCVLIERQLLTKVVVAGSLTTVGRYHSRDSMTDGQWRQIRRVRYPTTYKFPKNDIAVVTLVAPFVFNEYVNSIPYAVRYKDYKGKCLVSGFGRTSATQYKKTKILLLGHLDLLPWYSCTRRFGMNMRHFVCTSTLLSDVGKGDSGGPLVCMNTGDPNEAPGRGVLVGITSGTRVRVGSFFTRVSSHLDFVHHGNTSSKKLDNLLIWACSIIYVLIYGKYSPL